jgi:hypothetical protein
MELSERSSKGGGIENTSLDTHPLRNEAQLNCVSLRSSLDDELWWRAVKGQDERSLTATPLTALHHLEDPAMKGKKIWRAATSALTFTTLS